MKKMDITRVPRAGRAEQPGRINVWRGEKPPETPVEAGHENETFYEAIAAGHPVSVTAPEVADSAYRGFLAAAAIVVSLIVLTLSAVEIFTSIGKGSHPQVKAAQTAQPTTQPASSGQGANAAGSGGSGSGSGAVTPATPVGSSGTAAGSGGGGSATDPSASGCVGLPLNQSFCGGAVVDPVGQPPVQVTPPPPAPPINVPNVIQTPTGL